ncbi:MAG: hypothetical protein IT453_16185 [Planctomycetes bacterium]|nr:hypothetical protein [Planctomycetota bacterium]
MKPDLSFLQGHDLLVYSTDWCPDCARLKRFFDGLGVTYRQLSIDDDAAAGEKLERETGKRGVPYILLDGKKWVRGYHKEATSRLVPETLFRELQDALRG